MPKAPAALFDVFTTSPSPASNLCCRFPSLPLRAPAIGNPACFCLLLSRICSKRFRVSLRCLLQCQLKDPSSHTEHKSICCPSMVDCFPLSQSLYCHLEVHCLPLSAHRQMSDPQQSLCKCCTSATHVSVTELPALSIRNLSVIVSHANTGTLLEFPPKSEYIVAYPRVMQMT